MSATSNAPTSTPLANEGRISVLVAAMTALIASHPDHKAFAEAFRRCWLQLGSQHSNPETPPETLDQIDSMLQIVEEHCSVPLGVRPDREQ